MKVVYSLIFLCCFMWVSCDLEGEDAGPNLAQTIPSWHENCLILSDVSDEAIKDLRRGKFDDNDNEAAKKYLSCILLQSKVFDSNFKVNKTMVDFYLPKAVSDDVFPGYLTCAKEAKDLDEGTFEDKAWCFFKCYYNMDPEHFILP